MNYRIEKVNENVLNESRNLWDSIAKPIEGLGIMEKLITRIAGVQNNINVNIDKKAVVVFCADNVCIGNLCIGQRLHIKKRFYAFDNK